MKLYSTISEAFKNGTGDVFFIKDNQYVAVSRHAVDFGSMQAQGFTFLQYDETMKLAAAQGAQINPAVAASLGIEVKAPVVVEPATPVLQSPKKFYHSGSDMEVWGFLEEFPEFYNHGGL